MVNVNTSSVFQLQQINGMNQEIAANLVDYRNRKGPFKSLDDLIKVKGLSQVRLGALRSSLCVNNEGNLMNNRKEVAVQNNYQFYLFFNFIFFVDRNSKNTKI